MKVLYSYEFRNQLGEWSVGYGLEDIDDKQAPKGYKAALSELKNRVLGEGLEDRQGFTITGIWSEAEIVRSITT
jgi:hypothetical protein